MITGVYVSIVKGSLVLTAGKPVREEISDSLESYGFWTTMAAIFEPYFTNGSFHPFDAGAGNPNVGLTSAPCVAQSMDIDDEGNASIEGDFWFYADYMVNCPLQDLIKTGETAFQLVNY